jgi:hypothetical protein
MLWLLFVTSVVLAALVALLLRFAPPKKPRRDARPRIPMPTFRAVVIDLLGRLGLEVVEEELREPGRRLVAVRDGQAGRCVIFVEPSPPGDMVPRPLLDELAESVRGDSGSVGLLVTPYRIQPQSLDVPVELVDGARLRQLVAAYLPERLAELDGYFGFSG